MISNRLDIVQLLTEIKNDLGIDSTYSHFVDGHAFPYLTYIGSGQSQLSADGTAYWRGNSYQVELYFTKKDPALETAVEQAFLAGGWQYSKSEDNYLDDVGAYLIYYELS